MPESGAASSGSWRAAGAALAGVTLAAASWCVGGFLHPVPTAGHRAGKFLFQWAARRREDRAGQHHSFRGGWGTCPLVWQIKRE